MSRFEALPDSHNPEFITTAKLIRSGAAKAGLYTLRHSRSAVEESSSSEGLESYVRTDAPAELTPHSYPRL